MPGANGEGQQRGPGLVKLAGLALLSEQFCDFIVAAADCPQMGIHAGNAQQYNPQ